jgi:catechol 2,3-dioxygenase
MTESNDAGHARERAGEQTAAQPRDAGLPDALRLGPVRLQIRDLERSIAFYTRVLGLEARVVDGSAVTLHAEREEEPLIELVADAATRPVRAHSRLGLYHYAIVLPDRAALGRFLEHIVRTGTRIGASDHLVSEAIYLSDPDGLGIEVYADRPRSAWRWTGGQLAMATEPLDTDAVIAAARGETWTAMPRGTRMGHVHLHVGDLDSASRFYHGALGFDRIVWGYPGALFLSAGGYHHHLGVNTWARGASPAGPDDARLLEWRIVLPSPDDARAVADRLASQGFDAVRDGAGWIAADPWGTPLRLAA